MKKKKIEAISPIPLKQSADKKFYAAAVAVEDIEGESTLIIDIYRNTQKTLKIPVVRVVLTEKEFANFEYETGSWNYRQLENVGMYPKKINGNTVAVGQDAIKRILDHFQGNRWDNWFDRIRSVQQQIISRKREEMYTKRYDALEERIQNIPQVPEEFYAWCEDELLKYERYIFYKRKGRRSDFFCACCGETYWYKTECSERYEAAFEHIVAVPRENTWGRCEKCGVHAIYKPIGRTSKINDKKKCYMIQK